MIFDILFGIIVLYCIICIISCVFIPQEAKIIERTNPDGRIQFVIRQRHFAMRWQWVDAWINSSSGAACTDSFDTLKEAQNNMCYFDGSQSIDKAT